MSLLQQIWGDSLGHPIYIKYIFSTMIPLCTAHPAIKLYWEMLVPILCVLMISRTVALTSLGPVPGTAV